MARKTSAEALENKIAKAQEQVSKTKKQYDRALSVLSELLDKRDAIRKDELMNDQMDMFLVFIIMQLSNCNPRTK